jgi:hypothetical protein
LAQVPLEVGRLLEQAGELVPATSKVMVCVMGVPLCGVIVSVMMSVRAAPVKEFHVPCKL